MGCWLMPATKFWAFSDVLPVFMKIRKIPWRREWKHTTVFSPGKFHGWWSLVGYSPWGCKELDNWANNTFFSLFCVPSMPNLLREFSQPTGLIIWFLSFFQLMLCNTLVNMCVELSLHPTNKFNFTMVCDPFNMLINSVC